MKRRRVKGSCALEGYKARQADEVGAGPIIGFAHPLPYLNAARTEKFIDRRVAFIKIAHLYFAQRQNAVGQAFTLIDVEHSVFPHHGNDARFALLAISIGDLKLLHEIDLRAVLALAHVAAQIQSLLESEIE